MIFATSPIPKIFHHSDGGLMENCIMCNKNLFNPPQEYLIEKAFRKIPLSKKTEVIFEYAICMTCAEAMRNELSKESKNRIDSYFQQHVDFSKRQILLQPKRVAFKTWIKDCLVKSSPVTRGDEYSLYALASGKKMIYNVFPYAISGDAMAEVNELLSEKTREVLDDFIGNHFSGPPEVAEILRKRPVLV